MASVYPPSTTGLNYATYPAGPTTVGVAVSATTANVKGSYVEIKDSTDFASTWANLVCQSPSGGTGPAFGETDLADWAIGAAASEVIKVADQMSAAQGTSASLNGCSVMEIPWAIPSGSRVAVRIQSSVTNQESYFLLTIWSSVGHDGIATFVTYGAASADSGGTAVDPGGVQYTKGNYSQITASTSAALNWLNFLAHTGANSAPALGFWYFDIATGAAASEVVLIPDIPVQFGQATTTLGSLNGDRTGFHTYIASATRLAVRASSTSTDATDRVMDVSIIAGLGT